LKYKIILSFLLIVILSATAGAVFTSSVNPTNTASGVIDIDKIMVRAPILMRPIDKLAIIKPTSAPAGRPNNAPIQNPLKKSAAPNLGPLGVLLKLYVNDGDKIRKGELLAELDPTLYQAALNIADSRALKAEAGLNSLNEKISDLTDNLDKVDKNLTRMKQVGKSSLPPTAGSQKATPSLSAKIASLAKARTKLEDTKTQLVSALSGLETAKIQAQKGLALALLGRDAAKENLGRLKIYAPASGYAASVSVRVGEVIYPNQALINIYKSGGVNMEIYLPLAEAKNIRLKQKAEVVVDSFPNKNFSAEITHISPDIQFAPSTLPTNLTHLLNVQAVKLRVKDQSGILKPGMPADSLIKEN